MFLVIFGIFGWFWEGLGAILGAKTDQKVNQKWRSKSEAILGGFGRPKWSQTKILGGFGGHFGSILGSFFGSKNENVGSVFWNEIWIQFWMDFGRIWEVMWDVF